MKKHFISLLSAVALIPALSASAVTGSGTAPLPKADLLDVVFNEDGTAEDVSPMKFAVERGGDATTVWNSTYNRYEAKLEGNKWGDGSRADHFYRIDYTDNQAFKDALADGHTLEVLFMPEYETLPDAEAKVFASHQAGGTGIMFKASWSGPNKLNALTFLPNVSTGTASSWQWAASDVVPQSGTYYHVIGVWNKESKKADIYINGELNNEITLEGSNFIHASNGAHTFCIGGDACPKSNTNTGVQNGINGRVVLARIYDDPLTAEDAKNLYEAAKPGVAIGEALRQIWLTPQHNDYNGNWNKGANPRFATAYNGKVYTVNQQTCYIAEVTADGLKDVYKLTDSPAYSAYGTAISVDEAGNFLMGTHFTERPTSSIQYAVYIPATGAIKEFTLPVPENWTIGRLDCIGRVLGDLTKEAYFQVVPETGAYTSAVRVVKVTGDGTMTTAMEDVTTATIEGNYTQQNIAQPAYHKLADAKAADAVNDFYYSSCNGTLNYYASFIGGTLTSDFARDMLYTTAAGNNGFDTFVAGGKRYFVRNYATEAGKRFMSFVIMDENGDALATWTNEDFNEDGGYSSIITEPLADGTVNIYIYNSCNSKGGAAGMFNFDPSKAGEPVKPVVPAGDTAENPYKISTPEDLVNLAASVKYNPFYVVLENDIDMNGVAFATVDNGGTAIHFDGQNHIIKNLAISATGGNAALFSNFDGSIRNLGLADVTVTNSGWGCTGTLTAYVTGSDVVIENCFATGTSGASFYGGGLVAGLQTKAKLTMRNCYANVNISSKINANGLAGGLVGPCNANATLVIENCVALGRVNGTAIAGGIIAGTTAADVTMTLNNVVAWNKSIAGATANVICGTGTAAVTDAYVWDSVEGITVENGKTTAELQALVTSWPAFNDKLNDGYPVLAWQEANGESEIVIPGSKEHPYAISTPEELASIKSKVSAGSTYFTIENDIDMEGVTYVTPVDGNNFSGVYVFIDGKNHVIKNLTTDASSNLVGGLVGILQGEVRNLGLENINVTHGWGAGAIGGMTGHTSYAEYSVIDNCYITGIITSTGGGYAGAFGGYNNGRLKVTNSYADVAVSNGNYGTAGVVGWNNGGTTEISNVYVAGTIEGGHAAGIAYGDKGTVSLSNVAVVDATITGTTDAFATVNDVVKGESNGVIITDGTTVNEAAVEGATPLANAVKAIMGWEAFNSTEVNAESELPILAWQTGKKHDTSAIDDIELSEDVPAVYYNLQGVEVANPENGVYIVRRGNKVTKELVK